MFGLLTAIGAAAVILSGNGATAGYATSLQVGYSMDGSEETRLEFERHLNALAENNADWFRRHPDAPCCVACAAKDGLVGYVPPQKCGEACQVLQNAAQVLEQGKATCGPLAAYDAGVALAKGKKARVRVVHEEDPHGDPMPWRYHAVVEVDGEIHDPSKDVQAASAGGCGC